MRLINTSTLALEQFSDSKIPPYAILSHRWANEEVTYQELQRQNIEFPDRLRFITPSSKGLAKVEGFCRQAAAEGYDYAWMDTCW